MGKKKLSDKRKLRDFFGSALAGSRTAMPACRHFGECGGCEFQDVPYDRQLEAKRGAFRFILADVIAGFRERADAALADSRSDDAAADRRRAALLEEAFSGLEPGIVPSPRQLGYRQRMDYVFAFGKAGLRRVNRHRHVVELEECPLLGEQGFGVMRKARRLADAAGLESYDYMKHAGELRYFVVRRSRNRQVLLSLVTKSRDSGDAVLDVLRTLVDDGDIASGHWLLAPGLGDVSFGDALESVGNPFITEEMNSLSLAIGPNVFFQSNPAVAEKAYAAIRAFAPAGAETLDMYSGVGSIAATLSSGAGGRGCVTAVENVPENVALAEQNFRNNGLSGITLVQDDSSRYLADLAADPVRPRPAMVVVNPPRPGVEGEGMRAIAGLAPGRLAYLSCNPFTLLRNLADILDSYRVRSLEIYDMFPQTRHFESLALLEKN